MPYRVRPAHEQDHDDVRRLIDGLGPPCSDHLLVWQAAGQQTSFDPTCVRRWIAVDATTEQPVGSAAFRHERLAKFRLDVVVHPRWCRQGIGSQFLMHMLGELHALEAQTVHTRVPEVAMAAVHFFQRHGFEEIQRMIELRLDLRAFDPDWFLPLRQQLDAQGLTIRTLRHEVQANPACWDQLQELQNVVLPDWPDYDPGLVQRLEGDTFRRYLEAFHVIPDGFFIAKDGLHYIEYSGLALREGDAPEVVENSGTAVRREYRGRHLATVLKLQCLAYAKQQGYRSAATRSANPTMVRINENLGFRRLPGEVRLLKTLGR